MAIDPQGRIVVLFLAVQGDGPIVVGVNIFDPTLTAETHVPAWAYVVRRLGGETMTHPVRA